MTYPFIQARNYRAGRSAPVRVVVLHSMEASETLKTAENVARWFSTLTDRQSSAHYCCDADSIVQCVRESDTAFAAPGCNHDGIQIELAGWAKQSREDWADEFSTLMLDRVAVLVADLCKRYDIPPVFVDAPELVAGASGLTTHAEVSKAYKKSTHTDPGKNFPMVQFLDAVREYLATSKPPPPITRRSFDIETPEGQAAALAALGYTVDLKGAARKFQSDSGLVADSIIGPKTKAALRAALEKLG